MASASPASIPAAGVLRPPPWRLALQVILLVLAGFFVFAPALHGEWLWDDGFTLRDNPLMHDSAGWWKIWFAPPGPDFFPLTTTVEWLLWQLFGDHSLPFHVACLVLHLFSAFLLWRLFDRLGLRFAWWGALLFVVHPVVVESVAWVSELKNTVSLPFLLGALLAWLDYDERGRSRDYLVALGLFVAALLAKTSVVMLPFVLLLHAWWKYGALSRKRIAATLPFFAVALVLGLLTMVFQKQWAIGAESIDVGGWPARVAGAGWAVLFYFGKCLWPFDLMPAYPSWSFVNLSFIDFLPWLVIAIVFAGFWLRRESWGRPALLGCGFFLLNLAPVLGFLSMSYMRIAWVADHFVYLPLIGLIGIALAGAQRVVAALPRQAGAFAAAAAALLLMLGWQSRAYAANFRDQIALWSYTLQVNPASWLAALNLGLSLTDHGRRVEAEAALRQSLVLKEDVYGTHLALANVVAQTNRLPEAAHEYERALQLSPESIEAHVNYGIVLSRLGDEPGSAHQYDLATHCRAQSPIALADLAIAHFNLANVLLKNGHREEAVAHLEAALEAQPSLAAARNLLQKLRTPPAK